MAVVLIWRNDHLSTKEPSKGLDIGRTIKRADEGVSGNGGCHQGWGPECEDPVWWEGENTLLDRHSLLSALYTHTGELTCACHTQNKRKDKQGEGCARVRGGPPG